MVYIQCVQICCVAKSLFNFMFNLVLSYLQYTMGVISVAGKADPSITSILCELVGETIISE